MPSISRSRSRELALSANGTSPSSSVEGEAHVSFDEYIRWHAQRNTPAPMPVGDVEGRLELQALPLVEVSNSNSVNAC